jgi:hypothetical protein
MMDTATLETRELNCSFGSNPVITDVNFTLRAVCEHPPVTCCSTAKTLPN